MSDDARQLKRLLSRMDDPLWGVVETAECLGVHHQNLRNLRGLPEPVVKVRATRLWIAEEVREFAAVYRVRRLQHPLNRA